MRWPKMEIYLDEYGRWCEVTGRMMDEQIVADATTPHRREKLVGWVVRLLDGESVNGIRLKR